MFDAQHVSKKVTFLRLKSQKTEFFSDPKKSSTQLKLGFGHLIGSLVNAKLNVTASKIKSLHSVQAKSSSLLCGVSLRSRQSKYRADL